MLLWGPLIYIWGAYGAFFVQFGLTLLSYLLLLRHLAIRLANWAMWLILAVLLLGPVWFWFYEHPNIGWHPELTYFPLSILFLLALLHAHTGWFLVTASLLVLVKEDGALLAGSIHLAFLCLQYLITNRQQSVFGILQKRRFWLVLGGWAMLFIAGMAFLSFKNHAAEPEPRLQQALNAIRTGLSSRAFINTNLLLLIQTLLLLAPPIGLLKYGLYRLGWHQAGSILLVYSAALLAILLSNWVQGATYYGTNALFDLVSLTWPPRFVLVYAFSTVYTIGFWVLYKPDQVPILRWQPVRIGLLLFFIQLPIVQYARPDFRLLPIFYDRFTHRFDPQKEPLLPETEVAVIEKLAQTLPPHSNVFVFDYLVPLFHKHYNIWPTENQWKNADLAVIPTNDFQKLSERLPRVMKRPYKPIRLSTYTLYVTPAYEPYINAVLTPNANPK